MRASIRGSPFWLLGSVSFLLLLQSGCERLPDVLPTVSIEQIGTTVAQTLVAEAAEEVDPTAQPENSRTPTSATPVLETETPTPTITLTPSITPSSSVTLPPVSVANCVPRGTAREIGRVVGITDGDTIRVEIDGLEYRLRYIGMDTPERGQPFFSESTERNALLVEGKTVTLVKDVSETDRFDRLLRYVLVGDVFVNHNLVRTGYAAASTFPPDVACSETFVHAQGEAASEGIGLWAVTSTPVPIPTPPPTTSNCHPSYPDVCIPFGSADYDCAGGSGNGPNYIQGPIRVRHDVPDPDPHGLDRDKDGVGCESG